MGHLGITWAAGAALLVAALAACEPTDALNSANVSVTTHQLTTRALADDRVAVDWLSCGASDDPSDPEVRCLGRTRDDRKITVKGHGTRQHDLKCLTGHLTAVVGGRTVFDVRGLGNCGGRVPASR
jgi:hypothetical protein